MPRARIPARGCGGDMDQLQQMALAAGLSWASGIRLYATVFIVGMLGRFGYVHLPVDLALIEHDWVLAA